MLIDKNTSIHLSSQHFKCNGFDISGKESVLLRWHLSLSAMHEILVPKAIQLNIKKHQYIDALCMYYFTDSGIRNCRLNFSQPDEGFVMENLIYLELLRRGFSVDVGTLVFVAKDNGKSVRKRYEIDFVATKADKRIYIQSTLDLDTRERQERELNPFKYAKDAFKKIVIVKDNIIPFADENGILHIGVERFMLEDFSI